MGAMSSSADRERSWRFNVRPKLTLQRNRRSFNMTLTRRVACGELSGYWYGRRFAALRQTRADGKGWSVWRLRRDSRWAVIVSGWRFRRD